MLLMGQETHAKSLVMFQLKEGLDLLEIKAKVL